jgi:hypothetical protein
MWFWNPWNPWWWLFPPRELELPVDRTRLEKFCGMLGSAHDGERANAARFIARMAEENRLSIVELLKSAFGGKSGFQPYEPFKQQARDPWEDIRAARERDRKMREAQAEAAARERARRSVFDDLGPDKEEAARRWAGTKFDDVPPSESQFKAREQAYKAKQRNARRNTGEPLI